MAHELEGLDEWLERPYQETDREDPDDPSINYCPDCRVEMILRQEKIQGGLWRNIMTCENCGYETEI